MNYFFYCFDLKYGVEIVISPLLEESAIGFIMN